VKNWFQAFAFSKCNFLVYCYSACDGDTTTCQGCNRVPNSPFVFDACGSCANPFGGVFAPFNKTCNDCGGDGKPGGTPAEVYGHKVGLYKFKSVDS
jgi:hypothetical protein